MFNLPHHCPCYTRVGSPQRSYVFHVSKAFLLRDSSTDKPHIGGTVVDSSESGEGEVLRSEVAAAVGLLKHQFRREDFCRHHTLPVSPNPSPVTLVLSQFNSSYYSDKHRAALANHLQALVFSFQHDRLGRISQFHLDSQSLVLRQSRLLDFLSDEPTTDVYHMIRWMDNRPIGETKFSTFTTKEQDSELYDEHDTGSGRLPVGVRGA